MTRTRTRRRALWPGDVRHASVLVFALGVSLSLGACQRDEPPMAAPLRIPDDRSAMEFMQRFFRAYVNIDVDACLEMLCPADVETRERVRAFIHASQAPTSPFRVNEFQVRSVELMWLKREPMHRVEVSFPRRAGSGQILHVYSVRAREGCLEGFLEPPAAGEMDPRASDEPRDDGASSSRNGDEADGATEDGDVPSDPGAPRERVPDEHQGEEREGVISL